MTAKNWTVPEARGKYFLYVYGKLGAASVLTEFTAPNQAGSQATTPVTVPVTRSAVTYANGCQLRL